MVAGAGRGAGGGVLLFESDSADWSSNRDSPADKNQFLAGILPLKTSSFRLIRSFSDAEFGPTFSRPSLCTRLQPASAGLLDRLQHCRPPVQTLKRFEKLG